MHLCRRISLFCLFGVLVLAGAVFAQSPGTFTATGNLNVARSDQTATPLQNGLVLLEGGEDTGGSLASAELYNPATGSFALTGSLNQARSWQTATLLNDGKVLVVGGYYLDESQNVVVLASAELYDPTTGSFTVTGSLNTARMLPTATLLMNGKVLIAGGRDANGNTLASAELYDPATGIFTTTGSMNTARSYDTATLLPNGDVLIVGGALEEAYSWSFLNSAEIYDPSVGTFLPTGSMTVARWTHTATLVNNGEVLVAGGYGAGSNTLNSAELYDPSSGAFTLTGSLVEGRSSPTATLLINGQVLFVGGTNQGVNVSDAELYDSTQGSFSVTGAPLTARYLQSATLLFDGTILIAGGTPSSGGPFSSAELYHPGPAIVSMSPTSGPAATVVKISGRNFGTSQGTSTVTFNGVTASPTSWSAMRIVVPVPSGAATGKVVVTVGGIPSNGVSFSVSTGTEGIIHVQDASNGSDFNGSYYPSVSTTFNTATAPGNAVIVGVTFDIGQSPALTVSDSEGNAYALAVQTNDAAHNQACAIYYALNILGGPDTVTVEFSNAESWIAVAIHEYSGVATSSALDLTAGQTGTGMNLASGTVNTTSSGDLIFGVGMEDAGGGPDVFTAGSGFSIRTNLGSTAGYADEDQVQSDSGAVGATLSVSPADDWIADMAAFKAVSGSSISPNISGLSPISGPVGTSVTITGTNFGSLQGNGTVTFGGTTAIPIIWSSTSIVVPVPAGATTGDVLVSVGGAASNGVSFAVGSPFRFVQFDYATPQAPQAAVSVTYTDVQTAGDLNVVVVGWNDSVAQVSSVTDSQGNTYTLAVGPTVQGGTATQAIYYSKNIVGSPANGNTVTVTFNTGATSADVRIAEYSGADPSVPVDVVAAAQGSSSLSDSSSVTTTSANDLLVGANLVQTITTGPGAGYTSRVITSPDSDILEDSVVSVTGSYSATAPVDSGAWIMQMVAFRAAGSAPPTAPTITSVNPTSGPVGTLVVIVGSNFGSSQGTSTVTFNGTMATPTSWSATSVVATIPSGATTGNVIVTVGGVASNELRFVVTPSPAISSVSPSSAPVGASVTITGTNFGPTQGQSSVTVNGVAATVTSWSNTSIGFSVPSSATSGPIAVTVSGVNSNGANFSVAPAITGFSPDSGAVGVLVTITGTSFGSSQGNSTVEFNGTLSQPMSWSPTSIQVPVPPGASSGPITASVSGSTSSSGTFTVPPGPTIGTVTPSSGTVGTPVTIGGANFGANEGTSTVTFNSIVAPVSSWSDSQVSVSVPAGVTGTNIPVLVTVAGVPSNGEQFNNPAGFSLASYGVTGRLGSTATLLTNGLVLIAGGEGGGGVVLSSAELYNPSTETFTSTGNLNVARVNDTATLLNNGMVLIAGGFNDDSADLSSAELYDPSTGTFSLTGSMNVARDGHTATLLNNGMVLITGGDGDGGIDVLSSAELYDPSTGTFSLTGSMNVARDGHTATLLNNSKILISGGWNDGPLSSAELYSPSSGSFSATGSLNTARSDHTATLLDNGQVLIAGGFTGVNDLSSTELYDPSTGAFSATGSMSTARQGDTATRLNNGLVLIAGGVIVGSSPTYLSGAELYDPAGQTFSLTSSLNIARDEHTATLLSDGAVLIADGYNSNDGPISRAELYQAQATVTLTSSASGTSPVFGTSITFTATVTPSTATGTVIFYDGSTALGTVTLSNGVASLMTSILSGGSNTIVAAYSGDANFVPATSNQLSQAVTPQTVTVTLSSSTQSTTYGSPVTFTATVTPATATGTISFQLNPPNEYSAVPVANGVASYTTLSIPAGPYPAVAAYFIGDPNFSSSSSNSVPLLVAKATPTINISSSANPSSFGQPVTFTATVTFPPLPSPAPTGSVTFSDGSTTISSAYLSSGVATSQTSTLVSGNHSITASFQPDQVDTNFNPATSVPLSQVVNNNPYINSLSPAQGPPQMGFVIKGNNFGSQNSESEVFVNGQSVPILKWLADQIAVQVPNCNTVSPDTQMTVYVSAGGMTSNKMSFIVTSTLLQCPCEQ
jgi:Bacterial Ig-like domain (group 3)/IPT/TIG domain/Galactose oxidase, central domain/Kelch motif